MKKLILLTLAIMPFTLFAQQFSVISFNIRYNNPGDGINAWPNRIALVNGLLNFYEPGIFGLQEALYDQILDIEKGLPDYKWFGVGRDDGDKAGEFIPIFYNTKKFILIESGHFWLSEDCNKPGLGWDAACNRITTWGKFQSKVTGKKFFVFNTHFDHMGDEARKNSAKLIHEKINELTAGNGFPVILTGDFNLTPETQPIGMIKKYLSDSREISEEPPYGPVGTYNGFKPGSEGNNRIDYIFVNDKVKVLKYAAISDTKENRSPSDHLPLFVEVQLK
ncbi:endonuclease/exonuclease/phosphatase family protein [Maribellus sediminis]|uniref:endonuclease/exonuclease/phosphatase family protein n=1 Tax=Maribellus sediminis TaxID=2696285 RepID=UPI001430714E|nr:endonuclease/exonuclease/phosphatase family protein [Maribellus sediminis]